MAKNLVLFSSRKKTSKKALLLSCLCLSTLNITGCDYAYSRLYPDFKANKQKAVAEAPPFAKEDISIEKIRDEGGTIDRKNLEMPTADIQVADAMPEIPASPVTKSIITPPIETASKNNQHIKRIDNKVQNLSSIIARMSTSLTKLTDAENELDALTEKLEAINNQNKMEAQIKPANGHIVAVAPHRPTGSVEFLKLNSNKMSRDLLVTTHNKSNLIKKIRVGDHTGKSRIVIETAKQLDYDLTVNNDTATVTFPEGSLSHKAKLSAYGSQLIKSIKQSKTGNGTVIELTLAQPSKVLQNFRMSPDKDVIANQRIVIDLKR